MMLWQGLAPAEMLLPSSLAHYHGAMPGNLRNSFKMLRRARQRRLARHSMGDQVTQRAALQQSAAQRTFRLDWVAVH